MNKIRQRRVQLSPQRVVAPLPVSINKTEEDSADTAERLYCKGIGSRRLIRGRLSENSLSESLVGSVLEESPDEDMTCQGSNSPTGQYSRTR